MIFNLYRKVLVKLGDEQYEFERSSLMFKEVVAIEDATGYSFGEWQSQLGRYSIRAIAGLLHILRKRAGVPSDFQTLDFSADDLDVIPLHDDGTEFTTAEVTADIMMRQEEARTPTAAGETPAPADTADTSLSSPANMESAPGNGTTSAGQTSTSSGATPTPG